MVIHKEVRGTVILKGKLDIFIPLTVVSSDWKHWKATPTTSHKPRLTNFGKPITSIGGRTPILKTLPLLA